MTSQEQLDQKIDRWLEAGAPTQMPDRVLLATFERTRRSRQHRRWPALLGRIQVNPTVAPVAAVAVVVVAISGLALYVNQPGVGGRAPTSTHAASPSAESSPSAEPSPTATPAPTSTAPAILRQPYDGLPLGWSSDGTRLLIQKDDGNLFVRHADGSETQVTEQLSALRYIPGSARPSGATISPDGSRVVFAGLTEGWEGHSCHFGALFAVDADGGPAEVLWRSHVPQNGIVRYPTFSPDGTQIAFVDDYCDSSHNVWVMNADGSEAHQIVSDPLGAGHVYGLAWSAAGDRIALWSDVGTHTFAPDGSDFKGPPPLP